MLKLQGKLLVIYFMVILLWVGFTDSTWAERDDEQNLVEERYSTILSQWQEKGYQEVRGVSVEITPSLFQSDGGEFITKEDSFGYGREVFHLKGGDSFEVAFDAPEEGLYTLSFDYYLLDDGLTASEYQVEVNGVFPFYEARRVILPVLWSNSKEEFPRDRYGNEVMPNQVRVRQWQSTYMEDPSSIESQPLKIYLKSGLNWIKVSLASGELLSGDLRIGSATIPMDYEAYRQANAKADFSKNTFIILEAEKPSYKNDTTINPIVSRDLEVFPYETNQLLLNTLGGDTWKWSGQTVYYSLEVPEDGFYYLGFKYLQTTKQNATVYRTISIDGKIPFQEMKNYPFPYTSKWSTEVLQDGQDKYAFYLTKGKHVIGITADASAFRDVVLEIQSAIFKINQLSIEIRRLVGNDMDQYRDWEITDYLPTLQEDLLKITNSLSIVYKQAIEFNNNKENSQDIINLQIATRNLEKLASEPNKIPNRLKQLTEGTGSVTQSLSLALQDFVKQPLTLDQLYIYSPSQSLPNYEVSFLDKMVEGIKRFFNSFIPKDNAAEKEEIVIDVWMNRARNYMDLLQRLTDEQFTPVTGIKVNFSLMPDEKKLILANASGTSPDLALGISNWLPYDLGVRGAAYDLKSFRDFNEVSKSFSPGAFLPFMINDQVYALPETQDFNVLFYRKDLMQALNLPIPDTWEDVINLLPELQRYGMNFYTPLAGSTGLKPFMATAPFIYQAGGDLYQEDSLMTDIDSESSLKGIALMTDLFTIYGLPMQLPNFFEHFRDGTVPIGVGDFANYVKLLVAAPELDGSWEIALAPGIKQGGETVRWQPGSAQAAMIFQNSDYPEEAWEFLKWWESTDIQVEFANQLMTLYGKEYMWNTANLEAFQQINWPEQDKAVILEQWNWLYEVPKTPGGYLLERELSNIWTRIVFDGENLRAAVEDSVIEINKEIVRKMEEFGYIKNGKIVVPYRIPTIEEVESWWQQDER